jgi:hypothetical protein
MRSADGLPTDAPDLADVYELATSALPDTVFLATREGDLVWVCPNVERVVGRFVRTLRRAHPGIELVARRTETVAPGRDDRLDDGDRLTIPLPALTDRQRAALTAAHAAGYYDWPTRGTTAAELAESFGLAGSTFGQHLRVATGKLVAAFVDAT